MADLTPKEIAAIKRSSRRLRLPPVGSSPGTLVADPNAVPPVLTLTLITPKSAQTIENATIADVKKARSGKTPTLWLDCSGLADVKLIEEIGAMFGLHRLSLEDTVNHGSRPKVDFYSDNVFVVLAMIDDAATHRYEQISVYFSPDFVVTFQERPGDPFGPVRKRLNGPSPSRLRDRKADYLAYALIDAIVDSYFPLVEHMEDRIEEAEDRMVASLHKSQAGIFHSMRRGAGQIKRPLVPIRETLAAIVRSDSPIIAPETKLYFNDTLDHATTLIDMVDAERDMLSGLIELHLSMSQAQANETISYLTIVSVVFIPLTFLVGVWGMNFKYMPELEWHYGYPMALGFMAIVAVAAIWYFKRKKWL